MSYNAYASPDLKKAYVCHSIVFETDVMCKQNWWFMFPHSKRKHMEAVSNR